MQTAPPFRKGITCVGELRRIDATDGGVVYVLKDGTNESELFAAYVDKDAYFIELITCPGYFAHPFAKEHG